MLINKKSFFAAAVATLISVGTPTFAQTAAPGLDPFVGKWQINLAKSRMGVSGPNVVTPPRSATFTWIFTPRDYGLQMDVYTEYPLPAPTRTLMIHADGKIRPCQTVQPCLPSGGNPKEQAYAYHKMDDHMISRLFYVKGEIVEYDTYAVSKDGKTLVITAWHAPTPEWQNMQIFEKQP